jgi:two-component system, OmpR family, sensor kinase
LSLADRREWPLRGHWIDIAWVAFAAANLVAMSIWPDWETVPFHFIWVSLTLLYGFRVWRTGATSWTLGLVMATTGFVLLNDYREGSQPLGELTEVPLMAAMFVAMVWHARRRLVATQKVERVSEENARLLESEHRFLQDASHELRTPITVALGHAELIQRATTDRLVAEDARIVVDELGRLRRLAERLVTLASAEQPDFLRLTDVDVEPMVVDVVHRWTPTPRRWTLQRLDEARVLADPDRLALALDAIIENAVKHTKADDPIELSVERGIGRVTISVADGGSGIAREDLDRVFDRFAKAGDGPRVPGRRGHGLGLAIVKTVVEAHRGTVEVESAPGSRTTFRILLPLAGAPAGPESPAVARRSPITTRG